MVRRVGAHVAVDAHINLNSRAFYSLQTRSYSPRRPGDEMAIVPLADLFNHNGALASAPLMWAESEAHKTDPTVPIDHYVVVASKE